MGDGFKVFFVSMERVTKVFGSNDRELEDAVVDANSYEDHLFDEPGAYNEESHRWRRAVRGIFSGDVSDPALEHIYARAFESICEVIAGDAPTRGTCPFRPAYARDLDTAFDAAKLPAAIRWSKLLYSGAPVPIPWTEYPLIGSWSLSAMRDALPVFRAPGLTPPPNVIDPDEEGWSELIGILECAVAMGRDAISFYG